MRISDWSSDVCSSDLPSAIKRRLEHPRSTAQEDLLLAAAVASDVNHSRFTLHDLRDALKASGIAIPGDLQHQLQQMDLIKCVEASEPVLYALIDPGLGAYLRLRVRLSNAGAVADRKSTRLNSSP